MGCVDSGQAELFAGCGGLSAPVAYVIDLPGHPFDIATAAHGLAVNVVRIPVHAWNDNLTPWPASGVRPGDEGFGGRAPATLEELVGHAIPSIEWRFGLTPSRRAICGYSLGGLFALYAFAHDTGFTACVCLSGSLWYEGWVDYLCELAFPGAGRYAYFSLGKKESKAGPRIMRGVQDDTQACIQICRERGCATDFVLGPGNHMQHHTERLAAGLSALDGFLAFL